MFASIMSMNFKQKITKLRLPKNSYVVVGSGILDVLGIRKSDDIDLIVDKETYDGFEKLGWNKAGWSDQIVYRQDVFDIGYDWYGKTAQDLLQRAEIIDGIPYLSLDDVYNWKKTKNRDKDIRDLALIDKYKASNQLDCR